jgi:hypothetical protein
VTDDLVAFLKARLDEDEQAAQAIERGESSWTAAVDVGDEYNYAVVTSDDPEALQLSDGELLVHGGSNLVARCGEMYFDGENYRNHIARWDPARVLADVQAKRRIIDLHQPREYSRPHLQLPNCICCSYCAWQPEWPCVTMRLLALPYAGHDSYRAEWAPDTEVNCG